MLELKNAVKVYRRAKGPAVTALNNVSFILPENGLVFILGKSGSGKSTLLNVLGGLDSLTEGDFLVDGTSTRHFKPSDFDHYRAETVGFVFQSYNLLPHLDVGGNVALGLQLSGGGGPAEDTAVAKALEEVGLQGYQKVQVNELSGGQKQRVAIARALVKGSRLILADEPTGALDSETGAEIFSLLKSLSASRLVIVVSHDRESAERYGDRIIEIKDGSITSDRTIHLNIPCEKTIPPKRSKVGRTPLKAMIKMAFSSFRHKPIRLGATLLLSLSALSLFGVVACTVTYNPKKAFIESYQRTDTTSFSFQKPVGGDYVLPTRGCFSDDELALFSKQYGFTAKGQIGPRDYVYLASGGDAAKEESGFTSPKSGSVLYDGEWHFKIAISSQEGLGDFGCKKTMLAGVYPTDTSSIAVSSVFYETAKRCGYYWNTPSDTTTDPWTYSTHTLTESELATPQAFLAAKPYYAVEVKAEGKTTGTYLSFPIVGIVSPQSSFEQFAVLDRYKSNEYPSSDSSDYDAFQKANPVFNSYSWSMPFRVCFAQPGFWDQFVAPFGQKVDSSLPLYDYAFAYHGLDEKSLSTLYHDYDLWHVGDHYKESEWLYSFTEFSENGLNSGGGSFWQGNQVISFYGGILCSIALGIGVFAALLLATFIASSVSYQKRQIGILRALGGSSGGTYLTFQIEAWLVSGVSTFFAMIVSAILAHVLSGYFMTSFGVGFSVFPYSIWVVLILLAFAFAVSSLACAIPCWLAARKKPVDLLQEE
jgi:ABC-type lipoprotein export system ATPase subunit